MHNHILLRDYLGKKDLTECLSITNDLSFHWANWDETCILQRKMYKNFNQNLFLSKLNTNLNELKSKPVWLCNKIKVVKSDLYSLYESYLDSRLRLTWFERKEEILFSFESEQGPYHSLTTMKWIDKKIYNQFVLRKILLDYFTLRSFRLNTILPVVLKFNNDVNYYHDKVEIHQISEVGVILKFKDKNFFNKIKHSQSLEMRIPVKTFTEVSKMPFSEAVKTLKSRMITKEDEFKTFTLDARVINYYGNSVNSKRTGEDEFFIFARYEDFIPEGHEFELTNAFRPIVTNTKHVFDKEMQEIKKKHEDKEEKKSA